METNIVILGYAMSLRQAWVRLSQKPRQPRLDCSVSHQEVGGTHPFLRTYR